MRFTAAAAWRRGRALSLRVNKNGVVTRCISNVCILVFFPEIEEVGFSLDSIPGLPPVLCHFAVTPSRFRPRPRGSLDLVEEKRSVVSDP